MEVSLRNRPPDHRYHPLCGIRCLGTKIRTTPYPALVDLPRSFILATGHRSALQFHVLWYLHLVSRRLAAKSPSLVRSLDFHRPHAYCGLRRFRCFRRCMAYSKTGSSVDLGNRRSRGAYSPAYPGDDAGATVVLASSIPGYGDPVILSRLHLYCCRHHRKQ